MTVIKLSEVCPTRRTLTGLVGKKCYPKLVEAVSRQERGQPLFIDFRDITASGSFFSQAILPLRSYSLPFNLYPVLCNIDQETEEELRWLMEITPEAFLICNLSGDCEVSDPRWIGSLEEKQKLTFEAVVREQVTDASTLSKKFQSEKIGVTGWNNRLSALAAKGLIVEFKNGRGKSYRPVLGL